MKKLILLTALMLPVFATAKPTPTTLDLGVIGLTVEQTTSTCSDHSGNNYNTRTEFVFPKNGYDYTITCEDLGRGYYGYRIHQWRVTEIKEQDND